METLSIIVALLALVAVIVVNGLLVYEWTRPTWHWYRCNKCGKRYIRVSGKIVIKSYCSAEGKDSWLIREIF